MDIADFLNTAHPLLEQRLETLIPQNAPFPYNKLFEAARYSLFSGGKRLRPLLALASAVTFGSSMQKALDPACALECIHTYSLIHDDLPCMDNDDTRRGKPTLHRAYPEWHALLTGDFLLTHAFNILSASPFLDNAMKVDLIQLLSDRAGACGMIGGQMMDLLSEGISMKKAQLEEMHANKTAALLSAALECGAIVSHASEQERTLIRECGMKMGIAFQIADDIEDASHPEGSDQNKNKATAVSLLGDSEARRYRDALMEESLSSLFSLSHSPALLVSLFKKACAIP